MKRVVLVLLTAMFLLTGCDEDVVSESTCTKTHEGYHETSTFKATNDEIESVKLVYLYENSLFGVDTLSTLTDDQKSQIKSSMMSQFGLESDTYEGFKMTIDIQSQLTVSIDADLTLADPEILKKIGLDFTNVDMSLKKGILELEELGYTCE